MSSEFKLFPGKNLSELFKNIYDNQQNKKKRISELIADMRKLIRHAGDMAMLGPVIKDLVETSVKNDDALIKLASIAQKLISAENKAGDDNSVLTDKEKLQLLDELEQTITSAKSNTETKIEDLESNAKKITKKLKK